MERGLEMKFVDGEAAARKAARRMRCLQVLLACRKTRKSRHWTYMIADCVKTG